MSFGKLITRRRGEAREPGPLVQPLTVALISLVLVSLALATGLMDLRTLDKTLSRYIKERGLEVVKNVQQAARYNFHLLGHGPDADMAGSGLVEETFSLREAMILDLLGLAQRIDMDREQGLLDDAGLASLADKEGIWMVVLLDAQGEIRYQNRPVPKAVLGSAERVIQGEESIRTDLFGPSTVEAGVRSLAVRRKWEGGTILFALDEADYLFWRARVSIEQAVLDVGLGTDGRYFVVTDEKGRFLYQTLRSAEAFDASEDISDGEDGLMDVRTSLRLNGGPVLQASLGLSREVADQMIRKERQRGVVFIGFMVGITVLSMAFLYRTQTRHLAHMREMERRLSRAERLSAMGRLAAGVAHEIRNPLNAMSMACQRLNPDNVDHLSRVIRDEIRRLNQIVEDFLRFSRSGDPVLRKEDIAALVSQMSLFVEEEAVSRGIELRTQGHGSPLLIWMDADKIRQALLNIIRNAMESIAGHGTVTLALQPEEKGWVTITISDTGTGLSPEEMAHIFDPDYTTKEQGLGLGLALAHEMIAGHGGDIQVRSTPGQGTTFEVRLPVEAQGVRREAQGVKS